jgi:hypothetical protein
VGWSFVPALLAVAVSCDLLPVDAPPAEDFFASCQSAPDPTLPADCAGPDLAGWSNQPRPAEAGLCPEPPSGGCSQVVVGRLTETGRYMSCPGYVVLNRSDWTLGLNDNFIACTSEGELGTCDPSVLVVTDRGGIPDFSEDPSQTTVASRELCQLHNAGCSVAFADASGPGHVDCGPPAAPVGACCLDGGGCLALTAAACDSRAGAYAGDGSECALVECPLPTPTEYVLWYTGNVCCWGAPHLLITDRDRFDAPESASSYPGGGIDPSVPLVKVELRGGFASVAEANAWVCPQFTSSSYHYWCSRHYQMNGHNWQPYGLACDFSTLPETTTPPESNLCQ